MVSALDSDRPVKPAGASLGDLLAILYRPRETIRRILDSGGDRWSIQIIFLAFVCASVNDADVRAIGDVLPAVKTLPLMAIIALSILVGAALWVVVLFVISWIATPIGHLLGGTAGVADVRAALAWGMVPVVWSALYRIPFVVLMSRFHVPKQINSHQILFDFLSYGGCSIVVVLFALQLIFAVACIIIGSFTLGEVQRISTQKGFLNLAIALALPLLVIASAVFTFRR